MTTPRLSLPEITTAQASKEVTHNLALQYLDALGQTVIADRDLSAPPTPANGTLYIVGGSATGAWAGQDGNLAQYYNSAWTFYAPAEGWRVYVADEDVYLKHDGTNWINGHDGGTSGVDTSSSATLGIDTRHSVATVTLFESVTTTTFDNPRPTGSYHKFRLILIEDGTGGWTIAWPSSVKWPGGTVPTLTTTAGNIAVYELYTVDGGTTWYGEQKGDAYA